MRNFLKYETIKLRKKNANNKNERFTKKNIKL